LISGKGFLSASKRLREAVEDRGPEYTRENLESKAIKKFKLRISELSAALKQHADLTNHPLRRYFKEAERIYFTSYKEMKTWEKVRQKDFQIQRLQLLSCR
jgi:flagellar biosynthesis chaperone FliJ